LVPIEISFEKIGDNEEITDNKKPVEWDANGNPTKWEWMPGKGKKIFPDDKGPDDHTPRNKVYVKVKTGMPNIKVHLKAFDVDDPSTDPIIDPNDGGGNLNSGQDNLQWDGLTHSPKPPIFSNGDETIECTTDSEGIAKVGGQLPEMEVTTNAGDNFRVAVALMDDGAQELTKAQVMNKGASGYIAGDSTQQPTGFNGVVSPMLTVWRKLNVEVDSMQKWPSSNPKPEPDRVTASATSTQWQINSPNLGKATLATTSLPGPVNFYENGYIKKGSLKFDIIENTSSSITVNYNAPSSSPPTADLNQFLTGSFEVYDDDDIGLTEDPLPRSNLINGEIKKMYAPAYIEIKEVGPDLNPNSQIPYESNNNVANPWTSLDAAQDMKGKDRPTYWNHLLVVAYQPEPSHDSDPNTESKLLGVTVKPGILPLYNSLSVVYVETIRDLYDPIRNSPAQMKKDVQDKIEQVTGHEIGHAPGGESEAHDHGEGGLMSAGTESGEKEFTPATIRRFREAEKWH
jgi:hypothetical protein